LLVDFVFFILYLHKQKHKTMNTIVCPISESKVNETVTRINAALTATITITALVFSAPWIFALLAIDFMFRGFFDGRYSLIKYFGQQINKSLNLKPNQINAGSKIFAAKIGMLFSLLIFAFLLADLPFLGTSFAIILAILASLEAILKFCVACHIYSFIFKK